MFYLYHKVFHCTATLRSGKDCHIVQADFFPFPKNAEVVSHPVNAWKVGRAAAFEVPSCSTMTCIGIYRKRLWVPKATQSSSSWCSNATKAETARTTTSLSVVLTMTFWWPDEVAAATCRKIRESASSWLQGASVLTSWSGGELAQSSRMVVYSCFPSGSSRSCRLLPISTNSSCLFRSTRRKAAQLPGTFVEKVTFLRAPLPLCSRVPDFRHVLE